MEICRGKFWGAQKLVSLFLEQFELEVYAICEIPLLKDMEQNKDKDSKIY